MKLSKAVQGFSLSQTADGYSPVTVKNYKSFLGNICRYLEDPEVETIRADDLREFLTHLAEDGKSTATQQVYWKCIRSFYNWASLALLIHRPDTAIPAPDVVSQVIIPFTHEELAALAKACKTRREKALVLLLLDTGLRVSEAARLTIKDASAETGTIVVRPFGSGKKSRPRQVYLGSSARKALWLYLASREDGSDPTAPVLATKDGGLLDRFQIRDILDRIAERAKVQDCHAHKFRHTFAIEYLRNGGDVFTLQKLLGHSSLEMVKKYLDIAESDAENAHRKASPADRLKL